METYSIALVEKRTGKFIGWYASTLSIPVDRSKAVKFTLRSELLSGLEWCHTNWFRIYGYTPNFIGLTN